ncbi:hypothetical protein H0H92_000444 [Tricholoma furcatifolium]|nr:hypothetical protein H0H92_000444 [Tricholoma furcatifolium]
MDLGRLMALGATSKSFRELIRRHVEQNVHKLLRSLDLAPKSFLQLLRDTGSVITGSIALLAIHPGAFTPGDIDIAVGLPDMDALLGGLQRRFGMVIEPVGQKLPPPESHIDAASSYESPDVHKVFTLNYGGRRKANVIVSTSLSPMQPIFRFHSTIVMNCITHTSIFCAYPTLTLTSRYCTSELARFNRFRIPEAKANFEKALEKYNQRGFSSMWSQTYKDEEADILYDGRRVGDAQCLFFDFNTAGGLENVEHFDYYGTQWRLI